MSASGKFFRPAPAQYENENENENSASDDSSEDDEEEQSKVKQQRQTPVSANLSSDDEEEDEEEEEEEDDEPASRKRGVDSGVEEKKKKKQKINSKSFFDEEAEASDSEEEEEDEPYGSHRDPNDVVRKHYSVEDIEREQLDEDAREMIRQQDRRRQQAGGRFGAEDTNEDSVADMARDIEKRHTMQRRTVDRNILDRGTGEIGTTGDETFGGPSYSAVSQQSLVPSVSDPSLWMFSCQTGKEDELVYQIMNKCIAYAAQGKPLGITSAVAAQTKGKIYVESYSEPAVIEAMQGIRNLMQYSMRLVPINDMTTVMTVVPKKKPVKKNDWVRLTRGHYKGDLGLVKSVRDSGLKCVVQCLPRLDLTLSDLPAEDARIRRRTVRPPQKFFNAQEIAALGKHALRQRFPGMGDVFCDYFESNYYHDGYLLKEFTVGTMVKPCGEDEPPTLDELQRFRKRQKSASDTNYDDDNDGENEGSKRAASLLDELSELQGKTGLGVKSEESKGGLIIGDTVEVIEGDLVGLTGKLISLDGTTVKVKPNNAADLGDMTEVEFLVGQVRKLIPVGAHVKVTEGRYANETGIVVAVEQMEGETDCTAVVLTDMTLKEISVRTSQLQESAEVASGHDKLAGYELHDLVVLSGGGSANEVGVIVRVGREEFTVINNHGIVREVRPEELRGKRNASSGRAVALDVQGNQIRVGDSVSVAEGPHKGKTANIKRMSRAQLFLYSQTRTEHAGIFVVRSRSCVLAGSRTQTRGNADPGASPFSTPRSQSGGAPGGARGNKRDDGLVGKTVRIQAGQWKGYLGSVADATPSHVQVELHSRLKKVMVLREKVVVVGDKFGATEDLNRSNVPGDINMNAPTTPFLSGGATPMHGGATPMHGAATPMHEGGGYTPSHTGGADDVWRPGGSIDQAPVADLADNTSSWGGTDTSQQADPFSSGTPVADTGGWGASNEPAASTWGPSTINNNDDSSIANASLATAHVQPESQIQGGFDGGTSAPMPSNEVDAAMGDAGEEAAVWFMERVCVQLNGGASSAIIREINADKSAVVEMEDKSTKVVRPSELSMIQPKEHDMVLVTGGADVGVEGELVCIDGSDAILKDSNEDFKIVDFVHLAKIVSDA